VIKLEKQIEIEKNALALAMAASNLSTKAGQESRISNHQQNLNKLVSTLDDLKKSAFLARAEVVTYSKNLRYPNGQTRAQFKGPAFLDFLARKMSCYSNHYDSMVDSVKEIDQKIGEIKKIDTTAKAMKATTDIYVVKMNKGATSETQLVKNSTSGEPASAETAYPKKPDRGPSSVSGTEKIGESERALQRKLSQQKK
jgi:hypothetical protein